MDKIDWHKFNYAYNTRPPSLCNSEIQTLSKAEITEVNESLQEIIDSNKRVEFIFNLAIDRASFSVGGFFPLTTNKNSPK